MDTLIALITADIVGTPAWLWLSFLAVVFILLAFDLGVLNKGEKELGIAESLRLSLFYILVAVLFGGWVWYSRGADASMQYFTGYAIEKALSIDNVFVISLIFGYFAIPPKYQYRALIWGIIGVIVLRGLMIAIGTELIASYKWVSLVFAAFLAFTGIKMLLVSETEMDVSKNPVVRLVSKYMHVTPDLHGHKFFVRLPHPVKNRTVLYATPLLVALIVINFADLIFAVDSVPAIFLITTDTFIVYTANIMAILGLRALYFALAALVHRFHYLKYSLAVVLVFIGMKGFYSYFLGKPDPYLSLGITVTIIAAGIFYSLWKTRDGDEVVKNKAVRTAE